ncbi:hypothetical protein N6H18_04985 [Reichenbachiella agarivorans]|uniref:DUF3592 domain-containing protein n=1 Tax=Reichenbachiella agarivorans TaxID=2979464 RepID=A0ABY6CSJ1_9BACT|nr:hypothetical protein [Reichenbachiella agarivorans]UXP33304.1 hypothetical protein N6H18_04985 [Reichenbachiella agarivorans]
METIALTAEDIKKLKKQLIPAFIFPFVVMGIMSLMYVFVLSHMDGDFGFYFLFGVGVIFFGIIAYMIWALAMDIKGGVKYLISGEISDKRLDIRTSANTGSKGQSSTKRSYYLTVNGKEYNIDYRHYNQAKVGDKVVMEKAPKSGFTLKFDLVSSDLAKEETRDTLQRLSHFVNQKPIEQVMTDKDLTVLNRMMRQQIKARLFWMIPFLFIVYGLVAADMAALLIFMFPLVIVPAFQFFKICHTVFHYARNKSAGIKLGIAAVVQDKSTITSNRSSTKRTIRTTWKTIQVPSGFYGQLRDQDKIVIFKPKYGKHAISIMTQSNEECYLV